MRLLFITRKGDNHAGEPISYHGFEQAISKIADCQFAGEGWPEHVPGEDMDNTVKRLYGNDPPDWVIDKDNNLLNHKPQSKKYRVALFVSDLHGKYYYGIHNPLDYRELLDNAGYHAVFYRYAHICGTSYSTNMFWEIGANCYWVPWSVDTKLFKSKTPWNKRKYDVTFIGSVFDVYHLRKLIVEKLPHIDLPITRFIGTAPSGEIWTWAIDKLQKTHYVGQRYAELLDQSKILIFGSSIYRYPILKYFEGMASGCLVMANEPTRARQLGLVDKSTYIEINEDNWERKLEQYLLPDRMEAESIAKIGYDTAHKFHSHEFRAKEFIEILEKNEDTRSWVK